jgi:hypothetical protein
MKYEQISKNWKTFLNEQATPPVAPKQPPAAPAQAGQLRTYGDLQNIIAKINRNKTMKAVAGEAGNVVLDQIAGLIPGASNVKSAFDFFKTVYDAKDDKKTNTWLDKLNVDDQYSAIIDNTIENAFLKALYQMISQKPANEALPANYTVDADLEAFLKRKYANRTVAGRA